MKAVHAMPEQFVKVPLSTFIMIEKAAKAMLGEVKDRTPHWVDAREFAALTKKTKEQMRYIREQHPELVKQKPGSPSHYLYNYKAYAAMINR